MWWESSGCELIYLSSVRLDFTGPHRTSLSNEIIIWTNGFYWFIEREPILEGLIKYILFNCWFETTYLRNKKKTLLKWIRPIIRSEVVKETLRLILSYFNQVYLCLGKEILPKSLLQNFLNSRMNLLFFITK